MKCPKCGYISFDYSDTCPKCNKDISAEREKMNLPSYKPNPPSLLGALTGEANDSGIDLEVKGADETQAVEEVGLSPEDSQAIEAMEVAFKDSEELEIQLEPKPEEEPPEAVDLSALPPQTEEAEIQEEQPSLEQEPSPEQEPSFEEQPSLDVGAEEVTQALEDLTLEASEGAPPPGEQATVDEIVLEPDLSPSEGAETEKTAVLEALELDEEATTSFDIADLTRDVPGITPEEEIPEKAGEGPSVDLDELASMVEDLTEEDKTADVDTSAKTEEGKEEELPLDLESLELDLDLEEPDDKSP